VICWSRSQAFLWTDQINSPKSGCILIAVSRLFFFVVDEFLFFLLIECSRKEEKAIRDLKGWWIHCIIQLDVIKDDIESTDSVLPNCSYFLDRSKWNSVTDSHKDLLVLRFLPHSELRTIIRSQSPHVNSIHKYPRGFQRENMEETRLVKEDAGSWIDWMVQMPSSWHGSTNIISVSVSREATVASSYLELPPDAARRDILFCGFVWGSISIHWKVRGDCIVFSVISSTPFTRIPFRSRSFMSIRAYKNSFEAIACESPLCAILDLRFRKTTRAAPITRKQKITKIPLMMMKMLPSEIQLLSESAGVGVMPTGWAIGGMSGAVSGG